MTETERASQVLAIAADRATLRERERIETAVRAIGRDSSFDGGVGAFRAAVLEAINDGPTEGPVRLNPDPLYVVEPPDLGDSPTYWTTPGRRDFALLLAAAGVIALILLVASPILTRVL